MGKIQKMIDYAVAIANDDSHGYSQVRRWKSQGTDRDCSSLMYESANAAGYNVTVGPSGVHYTGSMVADFKRAGFTAVRFDGNLSDLDPGDILVNETYHTEMYIGNGQFVGAHGPEGDGVDGKPGDQTGDEISVCPAYVYWAGWDYVLVPPKEGASTVTTTWKDGNYTATHTLNIREKRRGSSTLVCQVAKGATLKLGKFTTNSAGNVWAQVTAGDHKGRFVCVRNAKGTYAKRK